MSLTVSLIAVLIPLLFMGDITGRLFREFAITLSVTILISAAVSLTLTPMLCAKLLRHRSASEQSRLYRVSERMFERMIAFYGGRSSGCCGHRTLTLVVAVATLAVTCSSMSSSRRASSRCRTRGRSRASPRPTRACRLPRWRGCSSAWRR